MSIHRKRRALTAEERAERAVERAAAAAEYRELAEGGEYGDVSLAGLLPDEVKAAVRERGYGEQDIQHLPPGTYSRGHGGHGLRLRVSSRQRGEVGKGKRYAYRYNWIQRLPTDADGKRRETALGTWPVVTLAEAERRALENLRALDDWQPLTKRITDADDRILPQLRNAMQRGEGPTFGQVFSEFYSASLSGWRDATASAWQSQMTNYVLPVIGDMHMENIGRADIVRVLEPLTDKPAALGKVFQKLNKVIGYAIGKGHIDFNPAEYAMQGIVVTSANGNGNGNGHAAVNFEDAPETASAIASTSNIGRSMALLFTILTGCRITEAVGATWQEIDLDSALWTIPAERMKTHKQHTVTLSAQAADILRWAYNASQRQPMAHTFVFQTPKGKAQNRGIINSVKAELDNPDWTIHGWRKTFSTWANELGYDKDAIEKALAHDDKNAIRATYNKAEYVDERREILQDWADYVLANVTLPAPRETPALW